MCAVGSIHEQLHFLMVTYTSLLHCSAAAGHDGPAPSLHQSAPLAPCAQAPFEVWLHTAPEGGAGSAQQVSWIHYSWHDMTAERLAQG
jgi:hypothetical protein